MFDHDHKFGVPNPRIVQEGASASEFIAIFAQVRIGSEAGQSRELSGLDPRRLLARNRVVAMQNNNILRQLVGASLVTSP